MSKTIGFAKPDKEVFSVSGKPHMVCVDCLPRILIWCIFNSLHYFLSGVAYSWLAQGIINKLYPSEKYVGGLTIHCHVLLLFHFLMKFLFPALW